ncbi:MAG: glycosyltransferase family 4 protein [Actinomycetia bacterium]|nr:glycosyltransferase family 4 protein [Actinomycetes bacterium]
MIDPNNLDCVKLGVYTDASMCAGAEVAARELVAALPPSIRTVVLGPNWDVISHIAAGGSHTRAVQVPPLHDKGDLTNWLRVRRELRDLDVLHLNKVDPGSLRYVEAVAHTTRGLAVVSVVHCVQPITSNIAHRLCRALARRADAVVAVGNAPAIELADHLGIAAGAIDVIPNAVSGRSSIPRTRPSRFTVGVLARFVSRKRVGLLVEAVAKAPGVQLLLGGDGPEREPLEALAVRLGIQDRTTFLGWVEPSEVLHYSTILASSSDLESHPISFLEAQHAGLPIVASNVGAVGDIVQHGLNGLLVSAGDSAEAYACAIRRLQDDEDLLGELERGAVVSASAARPDLMASHYVGCYRIAIARCRKHGVGNA